MADPIRIVALDPSLTAFGCAAGLSRTGVITTPKRRGVERLIRIRDEVVRICRAERAECVVVEGYGFAPGRGHAAREMGELGGVIRVALHEAGFQYVDVPPATLKRFACGKGNARKEEVLVAAVRRLGYEGASHDVADALWLYALARHAYGCPVVEVPKTHLEALVKMKWPEIRREGVAA